MKFTGKSRVSFFARFRSQLLGLVLLVFVPVFILTIHGNWNERQRQKQSTRQETVAIARLAAAKQENLIKSARRVLATVGDLRFLVTTTDRHFTQVHLSNLRKLSPEYLDIGLIEADGTLFCSTVISNQSPNLSGWSCFKRVMEGKRFAVGDLQNGTTEQKTLDFGLPIFDDTGAIQRVFFASLDISELGNAAAEVDLPDGARIMVMDSSGTLLARNPHLPKAIGEPISHHSHISRALKETESVFETKDLEKVEKLFAVKSVNDGFKNRLWVSVGVPTQAVFAGANESLRRDMLIITVIAVLALAAAYFYADRFFLRPLKQLTSAAQSLTEGKWTEPVQGVSGNGELAHLSRTFNEMAVALEEQRNGLQAANAQLEQRVCERTAQLEQAVKELEAFSYSVSHDLRSPVRHISGFVDLLRRELGTTVSEKAGRFLNVIDDSAKQMGLLIDDLLVFSRMGRVEMRKTVLNTNDLVQTTITNLEHEIKNRNIVWEKGELPNLQADPSMLRQVFVNLLSNAIKYTAPRDLGRIEIGSREDPHEIILFVRDNGVGFDMQYANKLFGVFQRLHHQDEFEGTGIGLANVRRIINRHGGRTWAEGKLNQGATFYFSLPKTI